MLKDNLKTLRRMTGLNQRQLADELGVSVKRSEEHTSELQSH